MHVFSGEVAAASQGIFVAKVRYGTRTIIMSLERVNTIVMTCLTSVARLVHGEEITQNI